MDDENLFEVFSGKESITAPNTGCLAVDDDGELCGEKVFGRTEDGRIKYCTEHIPSEGVPFGGRIGSLEFYDPEEDEIVTVE